MGFRAKRKSNCRVCPFLSKKEKVDFELAVWKSKFFKNFFDILQWYFSDPEIPKPLMWLEGRLPKWLNMCEMGDLKLENFPRCLFQMTSFICIAGSDDLRIHWFCHTAKHENISTMSAALQMLTSYPLQKGTGDIAHSRWQSGDITHFQNTSLLFPENCVHSLHTLKCTLFLGGKIWFLFSFHKL